MTPRAVDESPLSEFIVKMRDVFRRRLEANGLGDKRALEREMEGIMREYLGRDAWDATAALNEQAAAVGEQKAVPRETTHAEAQHDGKMLASGPEAD